MRVRIFHALLAGQIPIVAGDIHDLDRKISLAEQNALPNYSMLHDFGDTWRAHRDALALFNAQGVEGMRRRIEFVLKYHMPVNRIREMLERIREMANVVVASHHPPS